MWSLMARCDVLVNLLYPTMGETSGSVIRGLSLGKAMIVSDVGWFAELPGDAVLKVPVDEFEVPLLAAALELAADQQEALGREARRLAEREHALGHVADLYVAALEEAAGGDAVSDAVLRRVAAAAAAAGITDTTQLAVRLAEVGL